MSINDVLNFIGVGLAAFLLIFNLFSKKTLIGSFFKKYYSLMTVALTSLVLSFMADLPTTPLSPDAAEFLHHIFFIIFAIISVAAARYLPMEAAKYMDKK